MKKLVVLVLALLMVCASMTVQADSTPVGDLQSVTLKLKLEPTVIWSIPAEFNLSLTGENKIALTVEKMVCCSKAEIHTQDSGFLSDGMGHEICFFIQDAPAFTEPGVGYCNVTNIARGNYFMMEEDDFQDAVPGDYSVSVNFRAWIVD